jgi:gliding motility-associated-like protein
MIRFTTLIFCFCTIISQITFAQVNLQSGLIGFYNFNGSGADSSGNNNHAIVKGEEYIADRFGHPCNALRLNGDGQYVEFPKIITLENPEWSYSIWFKLEQLPNNKDDAFLLTYKNIQTLDDVQLYVDNDDNNIKIWNAISTDKTSTGVQVIQDIWYHVVLISANGNMIKIYVNGSQKVNKFLDYSSTGPSLMISSNYSGSTVKGRVWGAVDAVRIYNRPVNAQEALALYNFIDPDTTCYVEPVIIEPNYLAYIPNIFSPNNNDNNDVLYVRGENIKELTFSIYDRWGEKVFESHDIKNGWNGKYKNKDCEAGVYVYIANITFSNGEPLFKKGNITLVR